MPLLVLVIVCWTNQKVRVHTEWRQLTHCMPVLKDLEPVYSKLTDVGPEEEGGADKEIPTNQLHQS